MSEIASDTLATIAAYLERFPTEASRFELLLKQLSNGEDVFVRSNMTGHVTCSALILNAASTKILVIEHALLKKVLQPGGHYEFGALAANGLREGAEETGVEVTLHDWSVALDIPIDLDSHTIPANPKRNETEHHHHDFMYLARASESSPLNPQLEEVHGAKWLTIADWARGSDARTQRVMTKLRTFALINVMSADISAPAPATKRRSP